MRRRIRRIVPIALVAAALPLGLPSAAEARNCGNVKADGRKYFVTGTDSLTCDFMRKWSRRMARGEKGPRRWDCDYGWRSGGCTRGAGFKRRYFTYRPAS